MTTQSDWNSKTSSIFTRSNPMITDVGALLGQYKNATDPGKKAKVLILIRYYCREWLHIKKDKTNDWRTRHVDSLLAEVTAELSGPDMQKAMSDRAAGVRKGEQLPGRPLDTHLGAIYQNESLQPRIKPSYGLKSGLVIIRRTGPEGLHDDRLRFLDACQDMRPADQDRIGANLNYLDKDERKALLLSFKDSKWYHGASETPYSSPGNEDIWAEDYTQNFYLKPNGAILSGDFHHSSFLAGKPVRCAGGLRIWGGSLKSISNMSGHYRPNTGDLLNAILDLFNMDVDLTQVQVYDRATGATWDRASDFKAFGGSINAGERLKLLVAEPRALGPL